MFTECGSNNIIIIIFEVSMTIVVSRLERSGRLFLFAIITYYIYILKSKTFFVGIELDDVKGMKKYNIF